jgi:RNA polymerase sigma-70 factor (ECF subfamily)
MLRTREGCATSFTLLVDRHRAPVVHFLYRMVQSRPEAEELAQEVFLRVYRARQGYQPSARFTTWLFRIASRLALNCIRDRRHEGRHHVLPFDMPDRRPTVEQRMLRDARLREVQQAILALPPKQRAAVLMHKYDEMEYARIAAALGCSVPAVKSLLFRAYETLRARLAHAC